MTSSYLQRPLRTLSEVLADRRLDGPVSEEIEIDRLIAEAEMLRVRAEVVALRVGHGARGEVKAFANGLADLNGDTLRAWKQELGNQMDEVPRYRAGL